MRILVVIPHYFGPSHPGNNLSAIGSYIEPLGRVAAFNELIVSLHRHFGPNRHTFAGSPLPADAAGPPRHVDIVVIAMREHNLLSELGLTRGSFEVEFVDGPPPWLAFHAHRLLRDRLGAYDFYCVMEDDLSIHDPAFFEKVTWFQQAFGRGALLAPVRFEMSWVGTRRRSSSTWTCRSGRSRPFAGKDSERKSRASGTGKGKSFACPRIHTLRLSL